MIEHDKHGQSLFHKAILNENLKNVQALIKMGAKTTDTIAKIGSGDRMSLNMTPVNIAIILKNPKILTCLLNSSDISESMSIKGEDVNGKHFTSFELAVQIATDTKEKAAILVRNASCIHAISESM